MSVTCDRCGIDYEPHPHDAREAECWPCSCERTKAENAQRLRLASGSR